MAFQLRRLFTIDLEKNIDMMFNTSDEELAALIVEVSQELKCGLGDIFVDFGSSPDHLTNIRGIIRASLVRVFKSCNP